MIGRTSLKEIHHLAIPAILAGIAEPMISLADTAIIGRIDAASLAGVGIASSFFLLLIWVLSSIKSAISAIVSRFLGEKNTTSIKTLLPQAILFSLLIGVILYFVTSIFSNHIFLLYDAKGSVLEVAENYFKIRSLGFPLTLATYTIFGIFRGFQNTLWAMYISIFGGLLNILLDILLVFGLEGVISPLGVEGAAVATLIAQVSMFILALATMNIKLNGQYAFSLKLNPELKKLSKMSTDLFVRTLALNVAYYLGNRFSTGYGEEYIAAHTIAMNIWLFSAFFIDGYASAGNALAGKLLGQNNAAELYRVGKEIVKISVWISLFLVLIYSTFYNFIGKAFTDIVGVREIFYGVFWVIILSQPINAVAFSMDGIYKGLGETRFLRNVLVFGTFLGFVPVIYMSDYLGMHIYSVWIAFFLWMLIRGASLTINFRKFAS